MRHMHSNVDQINTDKGRSPLLAHTRHMTCTYKPSVVVMCIMQPHVKHNSMRHANRMILHAAVQGDPPQRDDKLSRKRVFKNK